MTHFKKGDRVRLNESFFKQASPHSQRLRGNIGTVRGTPSGYTPIIVDGLSPTCVHWSQCYIEKVNLLGNLDKEIRL